MVNHVAKDPINPTVSKTLLGFDYGLRKIGVAIGHLSTKTTTPLETVYSLNQKTNWPRINLLMETWQPIGLVVGIAYRKDGSENSITQPTLRFSRQLEGRYRCPVHLVDETLSTVESKRLLYEDARVSPRKLRGILDQVAAQLILQTWLSTLPQATPFDVRTIKP